jgi:pyruvate kinase
MCAVRPATVTIEETTRTAVEATAQLGLAQRGDRVVLTAGTTPGVTGSTDLIRIITF